MALAGKEWEQTGSAIADANGNASVTFQAPNVKAGLALSTIAVTVTGSVPIPSATVTLAGQLLAVKRAGDRGVLIAEGERLFMGQLLTVAWAGADPGALCETTLTGIRT